MPAGAAGALGPLSGGGEKIRPNSPLLGLGVAGPAVPRGPSGGKLQPNPLLRRFWAASGARSLGGSGWSSPPSLQPGHRASSGLHPDLPRHTHFMPVKRQHKKAEQPGSEPRRGVLTPTRNIFLSENNGAQNNSAERRGRSAVWEPRAVGRLQSGPRRPAPEDHFVGV